MKWITWHIQQLQQCLCRTFYAGTRSCNDDVTSLLLQDLQAGARVATHLRSSNNLSGIGDKGDGAQQLAARDKAVHALFVPLSTDYQTPAPAVATDGTPESPRLIAALRSSMRRFSLPRVRLLGSIGNSSPMAGIFDAPDHDSADFASSLHRPSAATKLKHFAEGETAEPRMGVVRFMHRQASHLVTRIKGVRIRPTCFAAQAIEA
jgi:hypothetical protein